MTDPAQAWFPGGGWQPSAGCVALEWVGFGGAGEACMRVSIDTTCPPPVAAGAPCDPMDGYTFVFMFASLDAQPPVFGLEAIVPARDQFYAPYWGEQGDDHETAYIAVLGAWGQFYGMHMTVQAIVLVPGPGAIWAAVTTQTAVWALT